MAIIATPFVFAVRMLHGLLQDRHGEFCIQRVTSLEHQDESSRDAAGPKSDGEWGSPGSEEEYNASEWHNGFQVRVLVAMFGATSV